MTALRLGAAERIARITTLPGKLSGGLLLARIGESALRLEQADTAWPSLRRSRFEMACRTDCKPPHDLPGQASWIAPLHGRQNGPSSQVRSRLVIPILCALDELAQSRPGHHADDHP